MRPAFMSATGHTKAEADGSESRSKARSHVERCVLSLRKFRILIARLPVALFHQMDDIVYNCAFLTHFNGPLSDPECDEIEKQMAGEGGEDADAQGDAEQQGGWEWDEGEVVEEEEEDEGEDEEEEEEEGEDEEEEEEEEGEEGGDEDEEEEEDEGEDIRRMDEAVFWYASNRSA